MALRHQVSHDLADDTTELEAVARKPGGNRYIRQTVEVIEDEVLVRCVSEEAGLGRKRRSVRFGKEPAHGTAENFFILAVGVPAEILRVPTLSAMVVAPYLEPGRR